MGKSDDIEVRADTWQVWKPLFMKSAYLTVGTSLISASPLLVMVTGHILEKAGFVSLNPNWGYIFMAVLITGPIAAIIFVIGVLYFLIAEFKKRRPSVSKLSE